MSDIVKVIQESGLEKPTAESLQKSFMPFFEKAQEWKTKAETIVVTDESQKAEMALARTARLELKQIRVEADKTRQALKEDSLRYGKAVQGVYNVIEFLIKPIEGYLETQEKFAEIQAANRKAALADLRNTELAPYRDFVPYNLDLGGMSEEDYTKLLNGAKLQLSAKLEAERKAEQERIERAKAEAEERERVRLENERLKVEAAERERQIAAERVEREKVEAEARAKAEAERKEAEEKARIEREKLEAARKEAEAKAAAERAERERIEAEMKAKAEKEAAEKRARDEAERKAKAAPDREKLIIFAESLNALVYPTTTTEEAGSLINRVREAIGKIAVSLSSEANKL